CPPGDPCYDYYYGGDATQGESTVTAAWPGCGNDDRTAILAQYYEGGWGVTDRPSCGDFTSVLNGPSNYSFDQWESQYGPYDYRNWSQAILTLGIVGNANCIESAAGWAGG